jgi:hypothetical protein
MPLFWMKVNTSALSALCIEYSKKYHQVKGKKKSTTAIQITRNQNYWQEKPNQYGRGILRNYLAQRSGLIIISCDYGHLQQVCSGLDGSS